MLPVVHGSGYIPCGCNLKFPVLFWVSLGPLRARFGPVRHAQISPGHPKTSRDLTGRHKSWASKNLTLSCPCSCSSNRLLSFSSLLFSSLLFSSLVFSALHFSSLRCSALLFSSLLFSSLLFLSLPSLNFASLLCVSLLCFSLLLINQLYYL